MNPPQSQLELFLNGLLNHSLQAGLLVGLVLLVQAVFRHQLTSRWRFALWWVVLLRLAVPFNLESAISLFNYVQPRIAIDGPRMPAGLPTTPSAGAPLANNPTTLKAPFIPPEAMTAPPSVPEPAPTPAFAPNEVLPAKPATVSMPQSSWHWNNLLLPGLTGLWLIGTFGLGMVVAVQLLRFRIKLARSVQPAAADLRTLLDECQQKFGITRRIEIIETDAVSSPALFGMLRLRLLLPPGLATRFSHRELQYIFLHELAHVKRGDLWLNWLVTILQIMHWFNPLLWLGFARLRADRELACDELALLRAGETNGTAYGETVIKLLAGLGQPATGPGLVGILEEKKQMKRRIKMIAAFRQPGRWSALAAILLLALAATALTDAQTAKENPTAAPKDKASIVAAAPPESPTSAARPDLIGEVRAKDGTPIAATVFLATAAPKSGTSTFCPSCYADCRKNAKTDAEGKFRIESLDPQLTYQVLAVAPGYQPKFVSKVDPTNGLAKIQLAKAERTNTSPERTIRGRVVDPQGQPIAGAIVEMVGIHTVDGGGRWGSIAGVDPLAVTDEQGEFLLTSREPIASMDLKVKARLFANRNFQEVASGNRRQDLVLTEGATLTGRVIHNGRPLSGVAVGISASDRSSGNYLGNFEIGTDAEGRFAFVNLPPDTAFEIYGIMSTLKSFGAISASRIRTAKDGASSDAGDLAVQPAYRLAGKVVLADGGSIPPKTRLLVSRDGAWDSMQLTLDADGNFDSPGLPAETISLSVRVKGYRVSAQNPSLDTLNPYRLVGRMNRDLTNLIYRLEKGADLEANYGSQSPDSERPQNLPLRGAETPDDHSREWKISGRVLDRDTREPLPNFRITPGQTDSFERTSWETLRSEAGRNGSYTIYLSKRLNLPLVLAEAEGYLPTCISLLPGDATNGDILLPKGHGPRGTIRLPDGTPAANVSVGLLGDDQNRVNFDPSQARLSAPWKRGMVTNTDAQGNFALPAVWGTKHLIAASTNGFAAIALDTLATNPIITLHAYGQITGTLTRPTGPGKREDLDLNLADGPERLRYSVNLHTITDDQGQFTFKRVPAGKLMLSYRQQMQSQPMRSWQNRPLQTIELPPGETLKLEVAGGDLTQDKLPDQSVAPSAKRIPGQELSGVVVYPDGSPAAEVEVAAQIESQYLAVGKGTFSASRLREEGLLVNTKPDGHFTLPECERTSAVMAISEAGFARVSLADFKATPKLILQKWGRIEGVLRSATGPRANADILPSPNANTPDQLLYDYNAHLSRTDSQGRFVLTYLPPGEVRVARLVPSGSGRMHQIVATLAVPPGQTVITNLGGEGKSLVGKINFAGTNAPSDLQQLRLMAHTPNSFILKQIQQLKTDEERKEFFKSGVAAAVFKNFRTYRGDLKPDGTFEIEDVPPGEYELTLEPAQGNMAAALPKAVELYNSQTNLTIPARGETASATWDCGTVQFQRFELPIPTATK